MPDSSHFKNHEIPPQPSVDMETILESGEIKNARELKGYWGIQLVEIKDDGDALFRPDSATDFFFKAVGMEARRSDLELMAYGIDKILEFGLVPTTILRTIGKHKGTLQRRIRNFYDGYDKDWSSKTNPEEIRRAAIFDYLLDAGDRHDGNFLIDSDTGKLCLVDHDFSMFLENNTRRRIIDKAREMGLDVLDISDRTSLERFLAHADSLTISAKPEIVEIIKKAQDRAEILLEKGQIPTTNT